METTEQIFGSLSAFLKKTWTEDNYRYHVYMAQKCLNLNECYFMQEKGSEYCSVEEWERLSNLRKKKFISQYSLLLKAEELVDHYVAHNEFPRLCIVDELSLSGHDFGSLMYRILDAIFEAWLQKFKDADQTEFGTVREAFIKSVTCKVYAYGEKGTLLDNSLPVPAIGESKKLKEFEWRKYMADVVGLLNTSGDIENTAFIPSFWLSREQYEWLFFSSGSNLFDWQNEVWKYGELEADIWQKSIVKSNVGVHLHMAFVCKEVDVDNGKSVCVTPYAFWGRLSEQMLDNLFARLSIILRRQHSSSLDALSEICEVPYRAATNSKLRFLYMLICVLELFEATWLQTEDIKNHDLEKISQNFGTIEKIYPALWELCSENSKQVRGQLRSAIHKAVLDASVIDAEAFFDSGSDMYDQRYYLRSAEDYFIHVDCFERRQTKLRRDKGSKFVPWSDFFYAGGCLSRYFRQFAAECALEKKIAALILLAQRNVITLTISCQGDDIVYAKVGEATAGTALYSGLSIENMRYFIPALIVLEKVCKQFDLLMESWAARFGSFLEERGAPGGLEERFRIFVENAYLGGSSMDDYRYVKAASCNKKDAALYDRQVYYQEQVAIFFRES